MTAPTITVTTTRTWVGLHCFAYWSPADLDTFLAVTVAPLLARLRADGAIADWFYIRYWEGGPHLRIRVRDPLPGVGDRLRAELAELAGQAPYEVFPMDSGSYYRRLGGSAARSAAGWHDHGDVREIPYRPETARYGGPQALLVAEEVFCRSSEIAARIVGAVPPGPARLSVAAELATATAAALGLDELGAARWLRGHAAGWRWQNEVAMLPAAAVQGQAARVLASQGAALRRRWDRTVARVDAQRTAAGAARDDAQRTDAAADPAGERSPAGYWAQVVRAARDALEGPAAAGPADQRWRWVWGSQLHMLFNRLGILPDEERSVCWLVAGTALAPGGPTDFFADGAAAADRRYHEASKFLPGMLQTQRPREAVSERSGTPFRFGGRPVPLPDGDPPRAALADVLRRRVSGRGRLTGPVTAEQLGTLVWSAHGVTHRSQVPLPNGDLYDYAHRPYPSAGAAYAARMRLIVRDVAGVAPGAYHVDDLDRQLWRLGPAPSVPELEASSMWFGADALDVGGIELAEVPALLGLYVQLGELRERYGMRALRFAVAEAGHLAQALSMVAAASGLALGMIGGFYDDVAHELLGLDGIDDVLVYLLPVGRLPGGAR
ncbi:thiopeptide-type bacteriocin biosynthesis protein [Solwaraspora sp. WMMA2065]|uniref:thiopeptide-type bacteriocin biosynthesis protein n=1 Tax=Solwaraspora sp. WMMA2065 TaxID=3015166 RepID=UPI00259BA902|nr:thiopeptide-type bacteriocin biosynthesis protein [Solwaraspora sp. WMMA2065]WJK34969.1 thiopeptide-type bacteriocin biosynthesis protein [Solwaraspora sp. WMMA2065]